MTRIVPIVAIVLAACSGPSGPAAPGATTHDPPGLLPASAFPRMTSVRSSVGVDEMANEVAHPDELRAVLDDAGFASAAQRSFGGGTGTFSRVLARGLAFDTHAGAAAFLAWFGDNAHEEIITAKRISPGGVPDGAVVFEHEPDGCCHNDVPVYLAAWPRGSSVLYLHVGGRRATTRAFVALTETFDREV